jgi:uncharacterized protein with HEPN domain
VTDDRVYLIHIKEAIDDIREFTREGEAAFLSDKKTQFAVVRSLEIIGEATKRLSATLKATQSQVPWRAMASMRDRLIHDYFGVDTAIVWEVVQSDLAELDENIDKILSTLPRAP